MSLLSKILPHTLCCFISPRDIDEDETRPSTGQDAAPTIVRKPMPYAMINVPHQPDIADEQTFRRMLNASPACPIEAGPVSNAQLRAKTKRKKDLSRKMSSNDVDPILALGSPAPASGLPGIREARSKTSKPRLNKKSSQGKSREFETNCAREDRTDRVDDTTAVTLAAAQSTEMVDILTPRNASLAGYDSDAKLIKTPEIDNAEAVAKNTPKQGARDAKGCELVRTDSVFDTDPALPSKVRIDPTAGRFTHSSPYPCTPESISCTAALQPRPSESPTVVLKRFSAGIANDSTRPPTELELSALSDVVAPVTPDELKSLGEAPIGRPGIKKDPDSPQTVIRRLTDIVQQKAKGPAEVSPTGKEEEEGKRNSLLTQLDPALLGYLSRFSELASSDLAPEDGTAMPEKAIKIEKNTLVGRFAEEEPTSSEANPMDQSQVETTSIISIPPSEHNSIHLFNMNIPTRLESQSTATIFSPTISTNASKLSLDSAPPMPSVARVSPGRHATPFASGRAEHNRKPSDPQTRHLFEQPGRRHHPYWKSSTTNLAQSKTLSERDDASSVYSTEYCVPNRSEALHLSSPLTVRKNVNSLAVGGRSASTEIPVRRSSRTHSYKPDISRRSFSGAGQGRSDRLNAATEVISKYLDGKIEDSRSESSKRPTQEAESPRFCDANDRTPAVNLDIESSEIISADAHRLDTVRLTPIQQRSSSLHSKDQAVSSLVARDLANEDDSVAVPTFTLKESATDLWNRAYREARADNQAKDFLTSGKLDVADLHLNSSGSSLQFPYRSRSSSILQTPRSALRRSQSAGPGTRTFFRDDTAISNSTGGSGFSKTLKRLSFWNLNPQRQRDTLDCVPWKMQPRDDGEVTKRRSTTTCDIDRAVNLRAAHTPPLSHYLGFWGSFPSHGREERSGSAGKMDNILTRNFGAERVRDGSVDNRPATLRSRFSTNTLSMMQNTSKKIFSGRTNKLKCNKSKSMSPGSSSHRIEKNQGLLLKRWQRQYRTKSSEWRGQMTAHGHRSSLSPGLPAEYPELEQVQGAGDFDRSPRGISPFYKVDASFGSVGSLASRSQNTDNLTKSTNAATQTPERQADKNKSSTWESIIFANMSDRDIRTKENINLFRPSKEGMYSPVKNIQIEAGATNQRTSKDMKMPGGFEDY